jgi:hypothetical protein
LISVFCRITLPGCFNVFVSLVFISSSMPHRQRCNFIPFLIQLPGFCQEKCWGKLTLFLIILRLYSIFS